MSLERRLAKLETAAAAPDPGHLGEQVRRWLQLDESGQTPAARVRIEAEVRGVPAAVVERERQEEAGRPKTANELATRARLDEVDVP